MRTTRLKTTITVVISIMLIAAMALSMSGCGKTEDTSATSSITSSVTKSEKQFTFVVNDGENETKFSITTEKKTVGEALLDEKLIAGDNSEYGLYVKTVNGITVDYDADGKYWAFYVNGKYAEKGVDATDVEDGATYEFKIES